jgi:hypothetical protein
MAFNWLRPALPAGAVLVAALLILTLQASPVRADPNELRIEPAALEVAPGGTPRVSLVADPPATTLTVWGIDILFDPDVITTTITGCDTLDPLPNSQTIGFCPVASSTEGGENDVVKVLGAMIFNKTEDGHQAGDGLNEETVLADITFEVIGAPGECSDLRLFVRFHADVDAVETNPQLFDGEICVEGDAPPSGTSVPKTVAPRTPDPTAPGGDDNEPTLPPLDSSDTGAPSTGDQTPGEASEGASPGQTGTGTGDRTASASAGSDDASIDDDGGDGPGVLFWGVLGLGALLVVSGAAWAVVRNRGEPPEG